jgi:hypothetical protein
MVWQIPDAVDTGVWALDDGWKYHPKYVEQFPDINKLCNVASCRIYIRILLGAHPFLHISRISVKTDYLSFFVVVCAAGDVLAILILTYFEIIFLCKNCLLKYILAQHFNSLDFKFLYRLTIGAWFSIIIVIIIIIIICYIVGLT